MLRKSSTDCARAVELSMAIVHRDAKVDQRTPDAITPEER